MFEIFSHNHIENFNIYVIFDNSLLIYASIYVIIQLEMEEKVWILLNLSVKFQIPLLQRE